MKFFLATALSLLAIPVALAQDTQQKQQELSPEHTVQSIGFLTEADLGEDSFEEILRATKGKVLNLKQFSESDGKLKVSHVRLITLQPSKVAGKPVMEVKIRNFSGLAASKETTQELVQLAQNTIKVKSAQDYKEQTEGEESAGKVYETYVAGDPNAPERCFSAPNGVISMRDTYNRPMAGSSFQCNDWIRRVERAYNIYCRRSWTPDRNISTFGCHCIY